MCSTLQYARYCGTGGLVYPRLPSLSLLLLGHSSKSSHASPCCSSVATLASAHVKVDCTGMVLYTIRSGFKGGAHRRPGPLPPNALRIGFPWARCYHAYHAHHLWVGLHCAGVPLDGRWTDGAVLGSAS